MKNTKFTYFKLNLIAIGILSSSNIYAQGMNMDDFYYRDYLDLAANRGAFSANAENVTLSGLRGNDKTFEKIPPFFATTNDGSVASLGRNNIVTANHMKGTITKESRYREWGQSYYEYEIDKTKQHIGADTLYFKTDKYVVEGSLEVANPELGVGVDDIKSHISEFNIPLADYYENFNEKYQAGSGQIREPYFGELLKNHNKKGAGLWEAKGSKSNQIIIGQSDSGHIVKQSVQFKTEPNNLFKNWIDFGDSGSALIGFDKKDQKWKILGVLSLMYYKSTGFWSPTLKYDFDKYKEKYENQIENYTDIANLQINKDNILKHSATLQINNDLNLGFGGLVFSGDHQTYNIEGNGKITKIAGFDIEKGNTVNLNLKLEGEYDHLNLADERFHFALHKIGKGTLNVNMETKARLRFGDGIVVLRNPNAFSKIHMTGYQPILKLDTDYAIQDKVFFGNGGGKLDLNGHNQIINNFSANNNKAVILNSNLNKANITFDNKQNMTLVHAKIGENKFNNLDIIINQKNKKLAFDGGFNVNNINIKNGDVTLQGHPTIHAYLEFKELIKNTPQYHDQKYIYDKLSQRENGIESNTDLTRPNILEQKDWEIRTYKAQRINLQNSSLNIGKDADVKADIKATNSHINIGGDIKHFIDRADGENTFHNSSFVEHFGYGFEYIQKLDKPTPLKTSYQGKLTNNNISLDGSKLTAYHSNIITENLSLTNNATISLNHHSNFNFDHLDLTHPQNINTDNSSNIYVKTLNLPNKEVTLNSNTTVSEQLSITAGNQTALTTMGKTIHLLNNADFNIAIEDELKNIAIDEHKEITFEHLDDQRLNKDDVNFNKIPENIYFTYQYDADKNKIILTRVKDDPSSNENLENILNGGNQNIDADNSKNPDADKNTDNNKDPDLDKISNSELLNTLELNKVVAKDKQLFTIILGARTKIISLDNKLNTIGRKNDKEIKRLQLLKLIHHTEQDFNTLAKDNFILNKVNFLTNSISDQQKENLWLNSGYSNNKFEHQHIILGTNFNYADLKLGTSIGQFKVKTDHHDTKITVLNSKLEKAFENRWTIQSHLTGLWADNDFNFYSESVKAPQKANYKEYALNFDVLAAYQYPLTSQLSITPKLGLGYSFEHSNKLVTKDFSKAKYQRQLANLLAGVGIDYQLNQFTFGAHLDTSQALILKGKDQQLGFKNNTAYKINTDNPDSLVKFGLKANYRFNNNLTINAESGCSTLSPFYINLGLGYRF